MIIRYFNLTSHLERVIYISKASATFSHHLNLILYVDQKSGALSNKKAKLENLLIKNINLIVN